MIWRVLLAGVEQVVSTHLGPGRVPGNAPAPCFSCHVSMYLAQHVGHWSVSQIGRFYNGRHHTTGSSRDREHRTIQSSDESADALIEVLTSELAGGPQESIARFPPSTRSELVEAVATGVIDRLAELRPDNEPKMAERLVSQSSNEVLRR